MHTISAAHIEQPNAPLSFGSGAPIRAPGGLVSLGGAEFRLPLLIGLFDFGTLRGWPLRAAGAGLGIGVVAALLGVAGGERLIPTLVLLCGVDVKLAGSLSLVVSLPTMLLGCACYSSDQSFAVIKQQLRFVVCMGAGSLLSRYIGSRSLGWISTTWLLPLLAGILVLSTLKVWRHE